MRLSRSLIAVLAVGGLMCIGLVGCGTEVTDQADGQPDPAAAADGNSTQANQAASGTAGLGDSITLQTLDGGSIQVTPLSVKDPVSSGNQFITPNAGNRFVGIRVRIRNVGDVLYEDAPSNGAAVVDRDDVEWDASFMDAVEPALGTLKITPGDARVGWITFEVGNRAKLRMLQFGADSGFGNAGQWRLK